MPLAVLHGACGLEAAHRLILTPWAESPVVEIFGYAIQYCGQNLSSHVINGAVITKLLIDGAVFCYLPSVAQWSKIRSTRCCLNYRRLRLAMEQGARGLSELWRASSLAKLTALRLA
jgi:hypothetical protein